MTEVYFGRVYILDVLVNFSLVYLERLASLVYTLVRSTLSKEIELLHLSILKPTNLLHESILVKSKTVHRQARIKIQSKTWPNMYYWSLLSIER